MSEATAQTVATVEIFEPPMCCPTGLCGPVQDQTLLDLLETVRSMESAGVKVARYQPNTNPTAFTNQAEVMAAVRARSTAALPITVVEGSRREVGGLCVLGGDPRRTERWPGPSPWPTSLGWIGPTCAWTRS